MSGLWDTFMAWNAEQEKRLQAFNEATRRQEETKAVVGPKPSAGLLGMNIDKPTAMESLGRGVVDLWEPVKQGYLNVTDKQRAQAYRQQRTDNEFLYAAGLLGRPPSQGEGAPLDDDMWRMYGRTLPLAPLMMRAAHLPVRESMLGAGASWNVLDALDALRKRTGLME